MSDAFSRLFLFLFELTRVGFYLVCYGNGIWSFILKEWCSAFIGGFLFFFTFTIRVCSIGLFFYLFIEFLFQSQWKAAP